MNTLQDVVDGVVREVVARLRDCEPGERVGVGGMRHMLERELEARGYVFPDRHLDALLGMVAERLHFKQRREEELDNIPS